MKSAIAIVASLSLVCAATFESGPPPPGPPKKGAPNIVLLITDDQDAIIGGWDSTPRTMQQTKALLESKGMWAEQWRIATPICAPSRSELFSSRYLPEIPSDEMTPSPKVSSGGIDQLDLRKVWPHAFPIHLREQAGYRTGLFGKCEERSPRLNHRLDLWHSYLNQFHTKTTTQA